jgi:hypothetical protein
VTDGSIVRRSRRRLYLRVLPSLLLAAQAARPSRPAKAAAEFRAPDGSFAFAYPRNWETLQVSETELILAPAGAYGRRDGAAYVTHGLFVGSVAVEGDDLEAATEAFLQQQLKANPDFQVQGARLTRRSSPAPRR